MFGRTHLAIISYNSKYLFNFTHLSAVWFSASPPASTINNSPPPPPPEVVGLSSFVAVGGVPNAIAVPAVEFPIMFVDVDAAVAMISAKPEVPPPTPPHRHFNAGFRHSLQMSVKSTKASSESSTVKSTKVVVAVKSKFSKPSTNFKLNVAARVVHRRISRSP